MSRWARISARTSSGAKRSNNPFQMMATSPAPASNCGNFSSASWRSSPRSIGALQQRCASPRCTRLRYLPIVELGERGKARPFGEDQPDARPCAGVLEDLAHEHLDQLLGESPDRHVGGASLRASPTSGLSIERGSVPGTASPCRRSRDRSCPWRRRRAWRHRRAAPPQSRGRRIRRAPPPGWRRGARPRALARAPGGPLGRRVAWLRARLRAVRLKAGHCLSIMTDWSVII